MAICRQYQSEDVLPVENNEIIIEEIIVWIPVLANINIRAYKVVFIAYVATYTTGQASHCRPNIDPDTPSPRAMVSNMLRVVVEGCCHGELDKVRRILILSDLARIDCIF